MHEPLLQVGCFFSRMNILAKLSCSKLSTIFPASKWDPTTNEKLPNFAQISGERIYIMYTDAPYTDASYMDTTCTDASCMDDDDCIVY